MQSILKQNRAVVLQQVNRQPSVLPSLSHFNHTLYSRRLCLAIRNVRRILVTGSMPPCRLRRKKFWKFDYEMVHLKYIWINNVVSIAPFSTPACLGLHLKILHKHRKLIFFACFRFLIFHPFFQKVSWPHLPLCAAAHAGNYVQHEPFFIKPEIHCEP